MKKQKYRAPKLEVIELLETNILLQGSNYGDPGKPGKDFDSEYNIIDFPDF